jgi:hypothetical protein
VLSARDTDLVAHAIPSSLAEENPSLVVSMMINGGKRILPAGHE